MPAPLYVLLSVPWCPPWTCVSFQCYINFNNEQFYIKLPDGSMLNYPNKLGDVKYDYFDIGGDAELIGIKMK